MHKDTSEEKSTRGKFISNNQGYFSYLIIVFFFYFVNLSHVVYLYSLLRFRFLRLYVISCAFEIGCHLCGHMQQEAHPALFCCSEGSCIGTKETVSQVGKNFK